MFLFNVTFHFDIAVVFIILNFLPVSEVFTFANNHNVNHNRPLITKLTHLTGITTYCNERNIGCKAAQWWVIYKVLLVIRVLATGGAHHIWRCSSPQIEFELETVEAIIFLVNERCQLVSNINSSSLPHTNNLRNSTWSWQEFLLHRILFYFKRQIPRTTMISTANLLKISKTTEQ